MNTEARILVAEDNAALNRVLCFTLQRAGYSVVSAANGRIAWEFAQQQPFDMVLTDYQMPEMNGIELSQRLRQSPTHSHTAIMLLTAKGLELEMPALCRELGIAATFPKPFSPSQVLKAVEDLLAMSTAT